MGPEIKLTAIELKDLLTLLVALAALITSVSVAVFNRRSHQREKIEDARKTFAAAIIGIASINEKHGELRKELGPRYDTAAGLRRRIALADQREFYMAKALETINKANIEVSSFENLLLAAALIDSGRVELAVRYYERAYNLAVDDFEKATAQRVYGRAVIALGNHDAGRGLMLAAASTFRALAGGRAYQRDQMLFAEADTYRRLLTIEIQTFQLKHVRRDMKAMRAVIAKMQDSSRARTLTSGLREIERLVRRRL